MSNKKIITVKRYNYLMIRKGVKLFQVLYKREEVVELKSVVRQKLKLLDKASLIQFEFFDNYFRKCFNTFARVHLLNDFQHHYYRKSSQFSQFKVVHYFLRKYAGFCHQEGRILEKILNSYVLEFYESKSAPAYVKERGHIRLEVDCAEDL